VIGEEMRQIVKFRFNPEGNGWMDVEICYEQKTSRNLVSDVPLDSINCLVETIIRLLNGSKREVLEWSLEPDFWIWNFVKAGENITFTFEINGTKEIVHIYTEILMMELYRSLRLLESKFKVTEDVKLWSWDFPHEKLNVIEQLLKAK
jgi:hypothetical protein